jgi:hypothetical protein
MARHSSHFLPVKYCTGTCNYMSIVYAIYQCKHVPVHGSQVHNLDVLIPVIESLTFNPCHILRIPVTLLHL